jgi:glycosyltransferase involved in cell wall biosynthesis
MSLATPLVSIILPTYNRPAFLEQALASVYAQTFNDWELIVADDGSEPETCALLAGLSSPRVRVLWLPHSGNAPAVRNRALTHARGEYVAFLDSDDVWMPEKLERQLASLRERPARRWGCTAFMQTDAEGKPLPAARQRPPPKEGWILEDLVAGAATVAQSSVLVERVLLSLVGGYDPKLPVCGDLELWVRLAAHSEVDVIVEPLTHVRRHGAYYADDLTALADLDSALRKMRRAAPRLAGVIRARRAKVAAGIAHGHARLGRAGRALAVLLASIGYSWLCREWWLGAARTGLALAPPRVQAALRACRRQLAARHSPQARS